MEIEYFSLLKLITKNLNSSEKNWTTTTIATAFRRADVRRPQQIREKNFWTLLLNIFESSCMNGKLNTRVRCLKKFLSTRWDNFLELCGISDSVVVVPNENGMRASVKYPPPLSSSLPFSLFLSLFARKPNVFFSVEFESFDE